MSVQELALQRNKYHHLSDEEWRWFLQQVEGRERTTDKLPTFATFKDWWYPIRLSCEQCSSEQTARYKTQIIKDKCPNCTCLDLTAGYGVDTYFLSEVFEHTNYVEQNTELCRIAKHNFADKPITIHNTTAELYLQSAGQFDLIYLDPARRDSHGGKVFRLEDCTPNLLELLPTLLGHLTPTGRILLKLSPMLDITQAISTLSLCKWDVHVVAFKNEVKEVLLLSHPESSSVVPTITTTDLSEPSKAFVFTREEEQKANVSYQIAAFDYLYEPNAAILKAGAFKLISQRFNLSKLDINTHLYASNTFFENFPGRVWHILSPVKKEEMKGHKANVVVRNYPLSAEVLKKKLRISDGGELYVIGLRQNNKPTLLTAERVL